MLRRKTPKDWSEAIFEAARIVSGIVEK